MQQQRQQQQQQGEGEGAPSSTSSVSDAMDVSGGGAQRRPSSASPTTSAQHFLSLPNRSRSAAVADATNHNGNHVARQLSGACNNNSALAAGDSGRVEDIYAKVHTRVPDGNDQWLNCEQHASLVSPAKNLK